jgi:hypothetical protein
MDQPNGMVDRGAFLLANFGAFLLACMAMGDCGRRRHRR